MEKKKIRLINVDACVTKQAIIEVEILFLFGAKSAQEEEPGPPVT